MRKCFSSCICLFYFLSFFLFFLLLLEIDRLPDFNHFIIQISQLRQKKKKTRKNRFVLKVATTVDGNVISVRKISCGLNNIKMIFMSITLSVERVSMHVIQRFTRPLTGAEMISKGIVCFFFVFFFLVFARFA